MEQAKLFGSKNVIYCATEKGERNSTRVKFMKGEGFENSVENPISIAIVAENGINTKNPNPGDIEINEENGELLVSIVGFVETSPGRYRVSLPAVQLGFSNLALYIKKNKLQTNLVYLVDTVSGSRVSAVNIYDIACLLDLVFNHQNNFHKITIVVEVIESEEDNHISLEYNKESKKDKKKDKKDKKKKKKK